MPKWTIFLISWKVSNFQSKEFVLITEILWQIFWRDNWRSLIVVVENFRYCSTLNSWIGELDNSFFWCHEQVRKIDFDRNLIIPAIVQSRKSKVRILSIVNTAIHVTIFCSRSISRSCDHGLLMSTVGNKIVYFCVCFFQFAWWREVRDVRDWFWIKIDIRNELNTQFVHL